MSDKKPFKKDPHFPKGISPAEVKLLAAHAAGWQLPPEEEDKNDMSMIDQLKAAYKADQPKVGRPAKFKFISPPY